jgi:hypothetical protein
MENSSPVSRSNGSRLKYLFIGAIAIVLVNFAISYAWISSGSNQWEFVGEKNGVQVYSLKTPGYKLKKFKGVTHIKAPMNAIIEMFYNTDLCTTWLPGCVSASKIERDDIPKIKSPRTLYVKSVLNTGLPFFANREFVVKTEYIPNSETKEIFYEVSSVPNIIPQDNCCVRVRHINNSWRWTPKENGDLEVVLIVDFDMAGFMPDFMFNLGTPNNLYDLLGNIIPKVLSGDHFKNVNYDFIYE